jgi:hypothetical protein
MTATTMRAKPSRDDLCRREVALVAKACEQRLKPRDEQDALPYWAEGSPGWDWVIESFLEENSYGDIVRYAATPELAANLIRQLALMRRQACLGLLQEDDDAAVHALKRIGAPPNIPARLSVPFQHDGNGLGGRWQIMQG